MYESAHDAYLESRVFSAAPLELVQMLYQAATTAVKNARNHLQQGAILPRSRAITHAWSILAELTVSLNHQEGGELSGRLAGLYGYMQKRLLEANLEQTEAPLCEVLDLLTTLAEAWSTIGRSLEKTPEINPAWSIPAAEACYSAGGWSL